MGLEAAATFIVEYIVGKVGDEKIPAIVLSLVIPHVIKLANLDAHDARGRAEVQHALDEILRRVGAI